MPSARAASICPFGTDRMAPDRLGKIRPGVEAQHNDSGDCRLDPDPQSWKGKEQNERLNQKRRVAEEFDEPQRRQSQEPAARQPAQSDETGNEQAEDDRDRAEQDRVDETLEQDRQAKGEDRDIECHVQFNR